MIGAGDIVADRLGRVAAEKDRPGMAHPRDEFFCEPVRALLAGSFAQPSVQDLAGLGTGGEERVIAADAGVAMVASALLRQAVTSLGGRGGGKGDLAQGGGDRLDLLDDALAAAARAVRGGVPAA